MDQQLFGERLKNAREASGMSRANMAERVGVKLATVDKWESGAMYPRANRLQMLASLLNVPLLWLLAGSQQVPDPTAGVSNSELLLQKIADMSAKVSELQSELDDLRILARAGN